MYLWHCKCQNICSILNLVHRKTENYIGARERPENIGTLPKYYLLCVTLAK